MSDWIGNGLIMTEGWLQCCTDTYGMLKDRGEGIQGTVEILYTGFVGEQGQKAHLLWWMEH